MKISKGLATGTIISVLISKASRGDRLKLVAICAGAITAIVFGPLLIENSEVLKNNYGTFLDWKSVLLGIPYTSKDPGPLEDAAQNPEANTGTIIDATSTPTPSVPSNTIEDDGPDPQRELFIPSAIENNPSSKNLPSQFDDSTFSVLLSDPRRFIGYEAAISGQVYDIFSDNNNLNIRLLHLASASPDNSRAFVFLQVLNTNIDRASVSSIQVEDCIIVQGLVRNSIADRNSLGQAIRVPMIEASSISKIECIDSVLPAHNTIEIGDTQSQHGLLLTARKVQFGEGHFRIKILAENQDTATIFIRDRESLAVQGDNSYQSITHLPVFSEFRLDAKLAPESITEGYLFFEQIGNEAQPITLRIVIEKVAISETVRSVLIITVK